MKPHSQRFYCSSHTAAICETINFLELAGLITEHARKTPDSLNYLLSSENQHIIENHIASIKNLQGNLPDHLRISTEKLPELLKTRDILGILDT
ncbi:hypothetical protein HK100_007503, partial [Physocladia obscura]